MEIILLKHHLWSLSGLKAFLCVLDQVQRHNTVAMVQGSYDIALQLISPHTFDYDDMDKAFASDQLDYLGTHDGNITRSHAIFLSTLSYTFAP